MGKTLLRIHTWGSSVIQTWVTFRMTGWGRTPRVASVLCGILTTTTKGVGGYGTPAPAAGYDFFQGPIVPSMGDTAHVSGVPVPDFKNLKMAHFMYYNGGGCVTGGDPSSGEALQLYAGTLEGW